jgi:hypothetical protein
VATLETSRKTVDTTTILDATRPPFLGGDQILAAQNRASKIELAVQKNHHTENKSLGFYSRFYSRFPVDF